MRAYTLAALCAYVHCMYSLEHCHSHRPRIEIDGWHGYWIQRHRRIFSALYSSIHSSLTRRSRRYVPSSSDLQHPESAPRPRPQPRPRRMCGGRREKRGEESQAWEVMLGRTWRGNLDGTQTDPDGTVATNLVPFLPRHTADIHTQPSHHSTFPTHPPISTRNTPNKTETGSSGVPTLPFSAHKKHKTAQSIHKTTKHGHAPGSHHRPRSVHA